MPSTNLPSIDRSDISITDLVTSPCVSVCSIDRQAGWCTGCLRTLSEIAAWSSIDETGKRRIIDACARRRAGLEG